MKLAPGLRLNDEIVRLRAKEKESRVRMDRITRVCAKQGKELERSLNDVAQIMVDMRHNLAFCRNGKVYGAEKMANVHKRGL